MNTSLSQLFRHFSGSNVLKRYHILYFHSDCYRLEETKPLDTPTLILTHLVIPVAPFYHYHISSLFHSFHLITSSFSPSTYTITLSDNIFVIFLKFAFLLLTYATCLFSHPIHISGSIYSNVLLSQQLYIGKCLVRSVLSLHYNAFRYHFCHFPKICLFTAHICNLSFLTPQSHIR